MNSSLDLFHPLVAKWFRERVGQPTDVQKQAWPKVASGEHLLVAAPTGSGKTLTAFLWALDQWITGRWATGHTNVLYVSPLRALNYDIQRNLLKPLDELREIFSRRGEVFPPIRVLTRTGDTPQPDRRQMLRHPPEILITTPESLNLLLSSKGGRSILASLSTVILDEIHAVFGTKRGTYLISAVDRLVRLSGEFQRIGLSATVRPMEAMAEFIGGFGMTGDSGNPSYIRRPVTMIRSEVRKEYNLRVSFPRETIAKEEGNSVWDPLVEEVKKIILQNQSTLVFVNSRRLCEMLTLMINEGVDEPIAYAHHGSLSLEIRAEVERRLKAGALRAIVATHSLELGIDIGSLDEVILIQSPFSISSAIQRVGRAGHKVGQVSRGTLFPTSLKDLLEATALAPAILDQEIESTKAPRCPLDVLAQVIVSMVGVEAWNVDTLYFNLKTSYPYRNLNRQQFDLVLKMLAGRYADSRVRELKPLVSIDRLDHTVTARRGALQTLYLSGGVIPDRGYFHLRHQETNARIGELDEEFVWEAAVGDTFSLGAQNWRIERITHNDVFVLPGNPKASAAPFWKGEENGRDFHFSERLGIFLEKADRLLDSPDFLKSLEERHRMDAEAAEHLIDFLKRQKKETESPLPHRHHLLVEFITTGPGGTPQVILHTIWGGRVNRPLAMALDAAWEGKFGYRPETYVSNDCIILQLPHKISAEELLSLALSTNVQSLLRTRLEGSGFFGARFRECAGRALLLPKGRFDQRIPLWLSRLRSQRLLEAVLNYEDFPILLETWRTSMQDEFDLESLQQVLTELESGSISWTEVHTARPSPFAQNEGWRQVNQYMYMDDRPRSDKRSRLRESLLREVVFSPGLRPTISREVVEQFELKRKRLSPGYSPQTPRELLDWIVERVAIPMSEWEDLLQAVRRDHGEDVDILSELQDKLVRVYPPNAKETLVASREMLGQMTRTFYSLEKCVRAESLRDIQVSPEVAEYVDPGGEPEERTALVGQWLQYYGPAPIEFVQGTLGIDQEHLGLAIEELVDSGKIIQGPLVTSGESDEICDSENFEILLRLARKESAPSFEPLGIEWLSLFLADSQGIVKSRENVDGLFECLEQLLCYPAEAGTWESEIFPARVHLYDPSWLDSLMQEGNLLWLGSEGRHITFCFESDLDLLGDGLKERGSGSEEADRSMEKTLSLGLATLFPESTGRYDFATLARSSKSSDPELAERIWNGVWQGRVTNDTFIALRRAIINRFKWSNMTTADSNRLRQRISRRRRLSLVQREKTQFFPGNWYLLPPPEHSDDLLETEERRKDRVRLLLDRYGILFRELLQKEWPALRWANVFRALRIMELSGEVTSGVFFHGIPGPQFISHRAFRRLQQKLPEEAIYWINATDPASLCGLQLDSISGTLPARIPSTHLVYRGIKLVLVSKRYGKDLTFFVPPDDPNLKKYMIALHHLLTRKFQPVRRITVETINGEEAPWSNYLQALRNCFDVSVDPKEVTLFRNIR